MHENQINHIFWVTRQAKRCDRYNNKVVSIVISLASYAVPLHHLYSPGTALNKNIRNEKHKLREWWLQEKRDTISTTRNAIRKSRNRPRFPVKILTKSSLGYFPLISVKQRKLSISPHLTFTVSRINCKSAGMGYFNIFGVMCLETLARI